MIQGIPTWLFHTASAPAMRVSFLLFVFQDRTKAAASGRMEVTVHARHQGEADGALLSTLVKAPGEARDQGIAAHTLTLTYPAGRSGYRELVLFDLVLLTALIVALAWMNKHAWKIGLRQARRPSPPSVGGAGRAW